MSAWGDKPDIAGRVIETVKLSDDRQLLSLTFMDGSVGRFRTYGDCCSQSWVEHLTVPPDIKGATITGLRDSGYADGRPATPNEYEESRVHQEWLDVLLVYQTAILTDRGEIVVEYRNDSNGYYGGSLDWVGG